MAEVTILTDLISQLGFPVCMCVYMVYVNNKTVKENTLVTQKMCDLFQGWINKYERGIQDHLKGEGDENE